MKHGAAFGDYITGGKKRTKRSYDESFSENYFRSYILLGGLVFLFVVFVSRLFWLQILEGGNYRSLSDSNRIRTEIVHAPRGIIFDRNNNPLVFNVPGFRKKEKDKTVLLSREKALSLIAKGEKNLEVDQLRLYPYKESLSHVIGYIGQVSEDELNGTEYSGYVSGDLIGKMGIEQFFEKRLTGVDGKTLIEVDSSGKKIRTLGQSDPVAGEDIQLNIDANVQKKAYEALKDVKKGVVIASLPKGEIVALVSKPSFDPNLFTLGESYEVATDAAYLTLSSLLSDTTSQPFLNRAISGTYPPGSTFKLVTAAAGLQESIIDESYEIEDTGIIHVGEFSFSNWFFTQHGKTDGSVNVVKAISRSNDIFFYTLAGKIGVTKLSLMADKFGLGEQLGIDLQGESKGIVPNPDWKKKEIGEGWYLGDTYHYGIGQGFLLTTPLQVNALTQVIANNGTLYKPHLLKNENAKVIKDSILNQKSTALITRGMIESCAPGGVGWPLFKFKIKNEKLKIDDKNFFLPSEATVSGELKQWREIPVACKTGTAQHGDEDTLPHSWITLFAPAYDPEIIVTVLAESSGEGSNIAGPIAKKVLEEWFSR